MWKNVSLAGVVYRSATGRRRVVSLQVRCPISTRSAGMPAARTSRAAALPADRAENAPAGMVIVTVLASIAAGDMVRPVGG